MKNNKLEKVINRIILIIFVLIMFIPIIWLILFSLKNNSEIATKSAFALPEKFLYQNYVDAWTKGNIKGYFFNSLFVSLVSLGLTLITSYMVAYALARMKWKLRGLVFYLFLIGMMVPIHATLIPLFTYLSSMGILKTYLAVILPYVSMGLPLGIFIFVNFLRSIPSEVEAASFIDGCSVFRTMFQIVLPLIKPAFATVGIFTFLQNWNEFILAATLIQNQKLKTLPLGLMAFQGQYQVDWGPLGAAIIISILPVILIYLFFSDRVENAFSAGAILK